MISESHTHLYLGPRPNGQHEYVDKSTGRVLFSRASDPPWDEFHPLYINLTPFDTPFLSRSRDFLSALRTARHDAMNEAKKSSHRVKLPDGDESISLTKVGTNVRRPRKRSLPGGIQSLLSTLPDGDLLRQAFESSGKS